jgi:hypothetical protein
VLDDLIGLTIQFQLIPFSQASRFTALTDRFGPCIPKVFKSHIDSLVKPQEKPVQYSDGEKDSTSYQEAPEGIRKASEDVSQPSCKTNQCKYLAHAIPL